MRNQLASLQSSFLLFREQSKAEIIELQGRVNGLSSVVQSQSKEIANLKNENTKLFQICIQGHATMPNNYSQELVENEISNHVSEDTTYASRVAKKTKKTNDPKAKHKPSSNKSTESENEVVAVVAVNDVLEKPMENPATCVVASRSTNNHSSSIISRDNATNIEQVMEVSDETDVEFVGVKRSRIKTQRFFLSGINEKVSSKQILNYLQDRQIIPTLLRVFTSKQKGTLSAKLNVRDKDSAKVLDKDFWPKYVRCRNWVSQKQFDKTRNQTTQK
ncbi:Hypothetical predicted protein [Paramuricea clavata]|uniref:Uncharacterized protein n=1 Tax=Paramuricea clavata TaxID=317549 RepID=A0A6S7FES2_PARCT|nr:Hypothetical predicted protein [Paramuricea clavata]